MSIEIINYNDISNLRNHKSYNIIKNTLHVCAIENMTKGMYETYGEDFTVPIISIDQISRNLYSQWENSLFKFKQYTAITKCIKDLEKEELEKINQKYKYNEYIKEKEEEIKKLKKVIKSARRNQDDILKSIRSLIECNVDNNKFICNTEQEKLFIKIWQEFEKSDIGESIADFKNVFFNDNCNEYKLKNAIIHSVREKEEKIHKDINRLNVFKKYKNDIEVNLPDKIVFHGFYYIKPIHDRLLQMIQAMGIKVIFLNWYDEKYVNEKYNHVFEIWDESFSELFGCPSKQNWTYDDNSNKYRLCDLFAGIYSGSIEESDKYKLDKFSNYELVEYDRCIDFINDYKEIEYYYSSENSKINDILKGYFPEKYDKMHFLSYPVGKFIYLIHNMWDEGFEKIKLNLDTLQEIFLSGCLKKGNIKAIDYTHDLYRLKEYMKNCETIDEWLSRLSKLIDSKELIASELDKIESNYMKKFSFFKISKERVENIYELVKHLKNIVGNLQNNKEVYINDYLDKLQNLLDSIEIESKFEDEKNIIKNIRKTLNQRLKEDIKCMPQDISEGLMLLLSGSFEDENEEKSEVVTSIKKIEALSLLHKNDENKYLHICQMSEEYMNSNKSSYTWPLNTKNIDMLINKSDEDIKRLLRRMKLINDKRGVMNKYLFYCLLQSSNNIKISWIKNWQGGVLDKSLYINLLNIWSNKFEVDKNIKKTTEFNKKTINDNKHELQEVLSILKESDILTSEATKEYETCHTRFYYSYLIDNYPTYSSNLHHQFLFTNTVRYKAHKNRQNTLYTFNRMKCLFPQWNEVEKKQLEEYIGNFIPYNDKNYREQVYIIKFNELKDKKEGYQNTNKCIYCPHIDYCNKAIYPMDSK